MKVGVVLVCAAGVLDASDVSESKREAYLRRLESCPEEELRRRLEFKLEKNDILGIWEIVQRKGVCNRVEKLDGYFAMLGMVLTDGVWHRRYARAFERSGLDVEKDGAMIGELMNEMATGQSWKEVNDRWVEMAVTRLEEGSDGGGGTRGGEPPNVVYHIASEIGRQLPSADRRWGRVLEVLLRKDGVVVGVVEGRYNEELRRIMGGDEELGHLLYRFVLGSCSALGRMMDRNQVLAREIIVDAIGRGYWLYMDDLEKVMGTKTVKELFLEGDAFEKVRARCGLEGEELSIGRLRELAQGGRLDGLVKGVVARLARHGEVFDLRRLLGTAEGRRVFEGLAGGEELGAALRDGVEKLVRCARIDELRMVMGTVGRGLCGGLLSKEKLGTALGEGMEKLIRCGRIGDLRWLAEAAGGSVCDGLVMAEELETALREGMGKLIRIGRMGDLRWLAESVGKSVCEGLASGGELDAVLKERAGKLVVDGCIDDLKVLAETLRGRFDGLLGSGEMDAVLEEGVGKLIRRGWISNLRLLIETLDGRLERLADRGELDTVLREGIEKLIRCGAINELWMLLKIRTVKRRVSGGLVSVGELDTEFKEMVKSIVGYGSRGRDGVRDLKAAMEEGVFNGLVSGKRLRRAWCKVRVQRARDSCAIA